VGQIMERLRERLSEKGLSPQEISRFVKDVATVIQDDNASNLGELNRRLSVLGWGSIELNDYLYQLIIALFEIEETWDVKTSRGRKNTGIGSL
jgi:hypothetical protein